MDRKHHVLVYNGRIWVSGEEEKHWMTFNASSGRVVDIGTNPPPGNKGEYKTAIDAGSSRIFPGFHDSHIHVSSLGESLMSADLRGCRSIENMQERIHSFAEANPDTAWITGRFWEQDLLGRYPNKEDIDVACGDRPAFIPRICDHIVLVNSKALEIAGISKDTPDPPGGQIDRYPEGHPSAGEPTGIVRESPAFTLVEKHRIPSKEEKMSWIKTGLNLCLKNGLTAVHSIEGYWNEYCELAQNNELPIRVFISSYYDGLHSGNFPAHVDQSCGELLSCNRVKLFVDGALGACTAALSRCYKNHPKNCGLLLQTQECLNQLVSEANSTGFRLELHIIGDQAADAALTALEACKVTPERRPILTHCQILREDLVNRMVKQGTIANIQPQFVTTDARWAPDILPPELLSWSYPWKTLMKRGLVCAGGSDSPVETPEPLVGIYDAIYRPNGERNPHNQDCFRPEECLSVDEALDIYTKSGAYTAMRESDLGQLMPGYLADFVVMDPGTDPVLKPECFLSAKVTQVWVAGKRVL